MTAQFSNSKWRHLSELGFRPRQIAHDEALAVSPVDFVFAQFADIAQALGHDAAGGGRDVDADPLAVEVLRGDEGRAAAAEGVEDDVVFVG